MRYPASATSGSKETDSAVPEGNWTWSFPRTGGALPTQDQNYRNLLGHTSHQQTSLALVFGMESRDVYADTSRQLRMNKVAGISGRRCAGDRADSGQDTIRTRRHRTRRSGFQRGRLLPTTIQRSRIDTRLGRRETRGDHIGQSQR